MWGWEPTTLTTVVYEPAVWWKPWTWRRVSHYLSTPEAEFDTEQVDLMIASTAYKNDLTPDGHLYSETTSEAANPNFYGPGWVKFIAKGPFTDYEVKARLDAVDAYRKAAGDNPNMNGMFWTMDRRSDQDE
jgi:hypothetical protein